MSNADRGQYAESVTQLSERELNGVFAVAEPPTCLLGGWAVHLHVTSGFQETFSRPYIGSRDIDLGVHIDPEWSVRDLQAAPVATTLERIESELGYDRGRFGFYQQFHRETGERLSDEDARSQPAHDIFRVDIDIIPDTTDLDEFEEIFGFRPAAEPLLAPVFADDGGEPLGEYASWPTPRKALIAPPPALAGMKIRAFPERDESHKRLKDLADLHALLWYVDEYRVMRSAVRERVSDVAMKTFRSAVSEAQYERTASLIDVDVSIIQQSIERLFV